MDADKILELIRDEKSSEMVMSVGKQLADSMFHVHGENVEVLREMICRSFQIGTRLADDPSATIACTDAHYHNHLGTFMNGMGLIAFTLGLTTIISLDKKMHDLMNRGELADYIEKLRKEVEDEN